ncbi:MAG: PH domain-containing protein [Chitinophagaceae bacterium]|nr:PH domain-containing protein [Chitinophagaceae bacterium]
MRLNLKDFLNENQDPGAVERIAERLSGILMAGEDAVYIAVQKMPAVTISPDCVALTSKRVIFFRPKHLGLSMEFQDYLWKDLSASHLKEEIFGAVFSVTTIYGVTDKVDYLPKAQARKLYTIAQEQEEIQREWRRERDLEEKRAAAGGVTVTSGPGPAQPGQETPVVPRPAAIDPLETLQKLKALLDNGLISQNDYDQKKAEILTRM